MNQRENTTSDVNDNKQRGNALDDFLGPILKYYRQLLAGFLAGTVPMIVAYFSNALPPWPPIGIISLAVEMFALIVSFQFIYHAKRASASRYLRRSVVAFATFLILFVMASSVLIYEAGPKRERTIGGFVCLPEIEESYEGRCPLVGEAVLRDFNFDADRVWTKWSIDLATVALCLTWLGTLASLSSGVGSFVVFQSGQPLRRSPETIA